MPLELKSVCKHCTPLWILKIWIYQGGDYIHPLKGDRAGLWAINVSGNWRIVFEFRDGHAYVVNYEDYH